MASLVRRKHINLDQALAAMSDPSISRKDAIVMWRKALRRADKQTQEWLSKVVRNFHRHRASAAKH